MTNRRKPAKRATTSTWKPGRPRSEWVKAIGAATGIVVLTVLVIFLIKPGDSTTVTPSPAITTPTTPATSSTPTQPAGSTTPSQP